MSGQTSYSQPDRVVERGLTCVLFSRKPDLVSAGGFTVNPRFLLLLILAAASAFGQTAAGTLTGIVTDPSGAVISAVPVTATHVDTGTKVVGVTSQTANFTIPQMPVGRYVITVAQAGFKTFREENVIIAAAQTLRLDISME